MKKIGKSMSILVSLLILSILFAPNCLANEPGTLLQFSMGFIVLLGGACGLFGGYIGCGKRKNKKSARDLTKPKNQRNTKPEKKRNE
jgi:hypothetical protein